MKGLVRGFAVFALMMLMVASFAGGRAMASNVAAPSGATVAIAIQDYQFSPKAATANVGDTVTWTNTGAVAHTVTASDGSWDSGNLAAGASFSHTFTAAGTVNYYCKYHGSATGTGMAASIVIAAAGGATPTSAPAPAATDTTAPAAATNTAAPAAPTATAAAVMTPTAASGATPSVEASDQPAGATLTVAKVIAAQDGWITVHANTAANQPGAQLGHTAVKAGENDNVVVNLSPAPAEGDKVWPMLHIDAGVIGTYEFPGPDAPVIINGNIVMKEITLTGSSSTTTPKVVANDQAVGATLTVAEVDAAQDGWITVHANTAANQPGAQLGHTAVKAGENYNVVVNLSPAPAAGDKVWPMLHIDAGVIGTYEFPGPDAPVIINGNIVMKEITLTGAAPVAVPTAVTSGGGTTTLPTTGNGPAVDLWLVAMLGLLLIVGGALALRRRNA